MHVRLGMPGGWGQPLLWQVCASTLAMRTIVAISLSRRSLKLNKTRHPPHCPDERGAFVGCFNGVPRAAAGPQGSSPPRLVPHHRHRGSLAGAVRYMPGRPRRGGRGQPLTCCYVRPVATSHGMAPGLNGPRLRGGAAGVGGRGVPASLSQLARLATRSPPHLLGEP